MREKLSPEFGRKKEFLPNITKSWLPPLTCDGRNSLVKSLRQTSFFSFEEWIKDTEWDERLEAILDAVPLGPVLSALPQPASTSRPEQHDRAIMIRAYVAKAIERIPTTETLRSRLRRGPVFHWIVGYRGKSDVPSAATFSRLFDRVNECTSLQAVHA